MVIPFKSTFFMATNRITMANHGISTSLHHYKWLVKHMFPDRPTVPSLPIKALSATSQARPRPCFTKRGSLDFLAPQGGNIPNFTTGGRKHYRWYKQFTKLWFIIVLPTLYIYMYMYTYLYIYMCVYIYTVNMSMCQNPGTLDTTK